MPLVDLALRPVPQGGVESFLIVCSSSIQEAISRMALLLAVVDHLIDPLVP